jgi:hypothetical protein
MAEEARDLGISTRTLNQWIRDNTGTGKLADKWSEFKLESAHRVQMTTREGKKQRRIELDRIRADAESRGLPKRGQYAWKAFISAHGTSRIDKIRAKMEEWLLNLRKPRAQTNPDQLKSATHRARRSRSSKETGK